MLANEIFSVYPRPTSFTSFLPSLSLAGPFIMSALLSAIAMASFAAATPLMSSLGAPALFSRTTGCAYDQLSCHNTTAQADTCCFESPGGLLMGVQLWDSNPAIGPADQWTIHGLWPDNCDGTWESFCDPAREYPSITNLLTSAKRTDLLDFMNKLWLDQNGAGETFWQHEWNKHGTCMSTFQPKCMPAGSTNGTDAVLFFNTAINLYKTRPTYDILAKAGILPSATTSYTYDQLTAAVKSQIGLIPAFGCNKNNIFEISYYYNARGSLVDPQWQGIDAYTAGNCPKTGPLWYLPKNTTAPITTASGSTAVVTSSFPGSTSSISVGTITSSPPTTTTTTTSSSTSSSGSSPTSGCSTDLPAKMQLHVIITRGSSAGCLLSKGTWAASGPSITCAGYTPESLAANDGSFILKSSKGACAVDHHGTIACGATIETPSLFQSVQINGGHLLSYKGSTSFSSAVIPAGSAQVDVSARHGANPFTIFIVPL